tara:strand:+ start:313 stop:507 length:195 start_codon:yes stop_codon:yes gene_type:complete
MFFIIDDLTRIKAEFKTKDEAIDHLNKNPWMNKFNIVEGSHTRTAPEDAEFNRQQNNALHCAQF